MTTLHNCQIKWIFNRFLQLWTQEKLQHLISAGIKLLNRIPVFDIINTWTKYGNNKSLCSTLLATSFILQRNYSQTQQAEEFSAQQVDNVWLDQLSASSNYVGCKDTCLAKQWPLTD